MILIRAPPTEVTDSSKIEWRVNCVWSTFNLHNYVIPTSRGKSNTQRTFSFNLKRESWCHLISGSFGAMETPRLFFFFENTIIKDSHSMNMLSRLFYRSVMYFVKCSSNALSGEVQRLVGNRGVYTRWGSLLTDTVRDGSGIYTRGGGHSSQTPWWTDQGYMFSCMVENRGLLFFSNLFNSKIDHFTHFQT